MNALTALTAAASDNGWETTDSLNYTRGAHTVRMTFNASGNVVAAGHYSAGGELASVGTWTRGKRETVIGWLTAAPARPAVSDTVRVRAAAASVLLSRAIDSLAADTVAATGISYAPMADAPDTYDALLNEYSVATMTRVLPVWDGASDATIYDGAPTNYAFRYWHDMGHVQFDCDFTPAGEIALQSDRHLTAVMNRLGVTCLCGMSACMYDETATLAAQLYYADTVGQIEYNVRHGAFPTDQREFCLAYVVDPAAALAQTY